MRLFRLIIRLFGGHPPRRARSFGHTKGKRPDLSGPKTRQYKDLGGFGSSTKASSDISPDGPETWGLERPVDSENVPSIPAPPARTVLRGRCWVIDGDTIEIDGTRLRLAGIDAPELDHPWGQKSKCALVQLCANQIVTAELHPELSYDRVVAQCFLPDGRDLAAELVRQGLALDWPRFSGGRYRHLEPAGVRKRLWMAHARQLGRLPRAPS